MHEDINKEKATQESESFVGHGPGYRTYFYVWAALLVLLAVTVVVAKVNITSYSVALNLFIASLKAGLVLAFFMHLKDEGKFLISLFLLTAFALAAIIALTFSDVWYR